MLSTLWAIWCVGGVGVTAKLVNSDASETAAAKVTAAAWTVVEVPNHTLAGTYCDVQLLADGAGTFYAVPLGANIGARGLPLAPRPIHYVDVAASNPVNGIDPGGAGFTDVDLTASTSPLACAAHLGIWYYNNTTINKFVYVRRNGSSEANGKGVGSNGGIGNYGVSTAKIALDDGQIFEYKTDAAAGDAETLYIQLEAFEEWG